MISNKDPLMNLTYSLVFLRLISSHMFPIRHHRTPNSKGDDFFYKKEPSKLCFPVVVYFKTFPHNLACSSVQLQVF